MAVNRLSAHPATVILPDSYEHASTGLAPALPLAIRAPWQAASAASAAAAPWWGSGDERFVVTPRALHPAYVAYVGATLGLRTLIARTPRHPSGDLPRDILADPELLSDLAAFICDRPDATLLTWGATPGCRPLVAALARRGAIVQAPDLPPSEAAWIGPHYDTKVGFRELAASIAPPDIGPQPPEGYSCHGLDDALACASHFLRRGRGCVLKANRGFAGAGTIIIDRAWRQRGDARLRDYVGAQAGALLELFLAGPIVVEQLVGSARSPAPSLFLDALIGADGAVAIVGSGRELRDDGNGYIGALIGRGAVPAPIEAVLGPYLRTLGAALAARGYRGPVGLDAVLDRRGRPIPIELNVRRGAAGFVRAIGARLCGDEWGRTYLGLHRVLRSLAGPVSVGQLLDCCDAVDRQLLASGGRMVPVCSTGHTPDTTMLGYVAFGRDMRMLRHAERLLHRRLHACGITLLD